MIQRTIDIKPATLDAFEKESKRLLLCLEEDRLLIVLTSKGDVQWNALEDFSIASEDWNNMPETLKLLKQQSSLLNLAVPDTQLFFRTASAMPVPTLLRESNKLFLQTQFSWQPPDEMLTDEVNSHMNVLAVVPSVQIAAIRHQFPQATWNSTLAQLLKQALQTQGQTMLPQLYLTLSSRLAEMVLMRGNELLMARCFTYYTPENLLYHLLNTCQQLRISPAELFIKAQGQLEKTGGVYTQLENYFGHTELLINTNLQRSKEFERIPAHYFTNLAFYS